MSIAFHWFLPTNGDGRRLVEPAGAVPGTAGGQRPATFGYLTQVALAAESFGFEGALTPTGPWCDDAWITTAALAQRTERLKFLVAFRPGAMSPTLAAQMAATYQFHTDGRLLLNVVTGGDSTEQRAYGDWLDKEGRYARAAPSSCASSGRCGPVGRSTSRESTSTSSGGALGRVPDPLPAIYFGGSSPAAARRRCPPRRHLPDVGRASGRWWPTRSAASAILPPPRGAPCASASACTS